MAMKRLEPKQEYILGISGASGVVLGVRALEVLHALGLPVHLIVSEGAKITLREETGRTVGDLKPLATFFHDDRDLGASISSGSYVSPNVAAMVVAPCSMKTLSAVAAGYSDTLIARAAGVAMKEGKQVALVVRESPFHAVHLEQFGSPEAVWVLEVKDFPAVVTMDAHGRSLHQEVADASKVHLQEVLGASAKG